MTTYAVGDIHGQLEMLKAAHERIEADKAREGTGGAETVFIGDYCDRGPDTKGVINWLVAARQSDPSIICLAGNHDHMMLGFADPEFELDPKTVLFDWLRDDLGGRTTLASYGVEIKPWQSRSVIRRAARAAIPEDHIAFLTSLPMIHQTEQAVFVHAGIDPERSLNDQRKEDLIWIRQPFLEDARDFGALIVHGHTPVRDIDFPGNRINIDTGAGYGRRLTAVVIENGDVFELTEAGRLPVSRRPDGAI